MTDMTGVIEFKQRLWEEPALPIEKAAEVLGRSCRTVYRKLHKFEYRRGKGGHIFITLRSIKRYLAEEGYHPSPHFDLTK